MPNSFDVLWLSASPSLKRFNKPVLRYLSQHIKIAVWEYNQTEDEASSIDQAVTLLYEYLSSCEHPLHLVGHGISGVLGLMFARKYPKYVSSLTLLGVAAQPAETWHAHYYVQRLLLATSREQVLANNVRSLFGNQPISTVKELVKALDKDLEKSPCMHSLCRIVNLPRGGVSMPLMVCGSTSDPIVAPPALHEWTAYLKKEDTIWECPTGNHFFHYFNSQEVGNQILNFWQYHQPKLLKEFTLMN
jgi:pimeloyl-ACP methyl ester carboxylesterase